MTYEVSGNADEPKVSVNPLAILAPGITRRIFEGKIPTEAQNTVTPPSAPTSANDNSSPQQPQLQ